MDGVMIDSERHWQNDERALLKRLVPDWGPRDHAGLIGLSSRDIYKKLVSRYGLRISQEEFIKQVDEIAGRIYRERAGLLEGFHDFLQDIHAGELPIGLASSAHRQWIETILKRFGLRAFFKAVVSFEDLPKDAKGKPAPDIYLYAARALRIPAKHCVAIEDATHGIAAAKAAGMFVIGLKNGFNDHQDLGEADAIAEGFRELTAEIVRELYKNGTMEKRSV